MRKYNIQRQLICYKSSMRMYIVLAYRHEINEISLSHWYHLNRNSLASSLSDC